MKERKGGPFHETPCSFSPHPAFVSALPGENTTRKISLFYPMRYDCLINITRRKNILFTFLTLWLSIFQLPAVKLLEVLGHYVNRGKEMLSWHDSLTAVSIMFCSRPIQAVPVASSLHKHSWTSSGRHTAAWQSNLVINLPLVPTD